MSILIVYGSTRGGTGGLAEMLADALRRQGYEVDLAAAREVRTLGEADAVVVGGALYMGRWHRDARRFVRRHRAGLSERPVWLFSSGPLDDSATVEPIAPVKQVRAVMTRIGARGHETFGGRLSPDATGVPAAAMAKERAGDWRDPDHVDRFARTIGAGLRAAPV
jgi:menaquinone-dependent protoporphyrinogen oxidase